MAKIPKNVCCVNRLVHNSLINTPPDVFPNPPVVYMWGQVSPAPDGFLPGDGDWYVTSVTVQGTNYPMTGGSAAGGGYYILQSQAPNYVEAAAFGSDIPPTPLLDPSLHVSFNVFASNICVFGGIGQQGVVVEIFWTWTDYGANTVNGSTILNQSTTYIAGNITTSFDITGVVTPDPPTGLEDAAFTVILFKREAAYVDGSDQFSGTTCEFMDQANYWNNVLYYAKCQYGTQCTLTRDTSDLSNITVTVGPVHKPLVDLADASYEVGINYLCAGPNGYVPYSWT